jgi:hypothetical protein
MAKRPSVNTKCVASHYACPGERIVEFSGETGEQGGLISFSVNQQGKMVVHVYRQGKDVEVNVKGK